MTRLLLAAVLIVGCGQPVPEQWVTVNSIVIYSDDYSSWTIIADDGVIWKGWQYDHIQELVHAGDRVLIRGGYEFKTIMAIDLAARRSELTQEQGEE